MSEDGDLIGLREFARVSGVSLTAIQHAIDDGRLTAVVRTPAGRKLKRTESLEQWEQLRSDPESTPFPWGLEKTKQEALLAEERRRKLQLEREELEGVLHRAEDVESVWAEILMRFRSRVLGIPSVAAPIIAAIPERSPAAIQAELELLVHQALAELSEYDKEPIRAARRRREARGG